jgi:hypothetical protein
VAPQVAACANHAEREAIGICVQCRTRVCSECATKVEGINYCVSCLAGLAVDGGRQAEPRVVGSLRAGYVSATAYLVTLWALVWGFLEIVLPGGR